MLVGKVMFTIVLERLMFFFSLPAMLLVNVSLYTVKKGKKNPEWGKIISYLALGRNCLVGVAQLASGRPLSECSRPEHTRSSRHGSPFTAAGTSVVWPFSWARLYSLRYPRSSLSRFSTILLRIINPIRLSFICLEYCAEKSLYYP